MIYGHINNRDTYEFLEIDPFWRICFEHIKEINSDIPTGIYNINSNAIKVNIMNYNTRNRNGCKYESHLRNIDLQYTISGSEIIDCDLVENLKKNGFYDKEKDVQFYIGSRSSVSLPMRPGNFAIFFPSDAHRPQINNSNNKSIHKLVIKRNFS